MKSALLSFAPVLLVLVGCAGAETDSQDPQDKLTKLEIQMTQKLDKANAVYDRLIEDFLKMERRVAGLESENSMLKIDIKKLNDKLDQAGSPAPRGGQEPGVDLAAVGMKIDQVLSKLKTTGNVDEAVKELMPLARYSVPKLTEALKQVASPDYVASLEKVLAKFPAAELKGPLEEAAKDRLRRTSVARVVGGAGDKELSKILEPYTSDPDAIVQVEVGQAMLACKNRMGVPSLLKALGAPESEIRFRAILSLKRLNKGETFGFDMNKSAEENDAAIKAWYDWWARDGQKLFE